MKTGFLKLLILCFGISLGSCSTFYNRHYTKGFFYDGLAHRARPAIRAEQQETETPQAKDSPPMTALKDVPEEKTAFSKKPKPAPTPETISASAGPKSVEPSDAFTSGVLKKALKPVNKRIHAAQHKVSVIGKAALYILALVLAVGIVALAIYFLPSILLPAQVVTTFTTILLIGAIIVLCVFAFLIYTLIHLLIDLFKHKKTPEAEAAEDF